MSNLHLGLKCVEGSIDHSSSLSHDIGALYLKDEYSDIILTVNGQKFFGHKVILAARSQYFRALLFGGLRESHQEEVELKGAGLLAFKILLKYIYTGHINLSSEKEDVVLDILSLAHQYGFQELETAVCDYLKEILCTNNVCVIYDVACLYCLHGLSTVCEDFMDKNASTVLTNESFLSLSPVALKSIIKRDSFCSSEIQIYQAVREWHKHNSELYSSQISDILSLIRLPLISLDDLLNIVRPSTLISPDNILDAIKSKTECKDTDLQYRGYLMPGENVAVPSKDATVILGEMRANLLDGNTTVYDMDRGFTRHPIDDNNGLGIIVKLGRQCIINYMRLLLWDKDHRAYSYYIDVSMDQKDWVRIIDHTRCHCRSWQFLHFSPRVVRYIKIVGTNNTINRVFHVVAFEAYYTKQEVELQKGFIVPQGNVALVPKSAKVIEGVSRVRNNLLNCDINHYDWDSGYTCHQLGSGAISIQLGQPYWLSSCKLLLWDCDDRTYSYYIETSVNGREYEIVVDKTREACKSWQLIHFEPRAVVYFKIMGTFNSANEVFHCVHFECPAQPGSEFRQKGARRSVSSDPSVNVDPGAPLRQPRELDFFFAAIRIGDAQDVDNDNGDAEGRWMEAGARPPRDRDRSHEGESDHNSNGSDEENEEELFMNPRP